MERQKLFEETAIPKAVMTLAVPTILSSLVMVLYNLADTYFVGMLNDPIQNAAVTLAGPVLLAFNAVNNLFGVGTSSLMSRALGKKDFETAERSSAFGFWCAVLFSGMLSLGCGLLSEPLLNLLGTKPESAATTAEYLKWTAVCGAVPAILNVVMSFMVRSEGGALHASIGTMSGCLLNIALDPLFILPSCLNMGAAGAGLATFLSNCVACGYFFVLLYVRRGKTCVSIDPKKLRWKKEIVLGILAVGVPAAIQNLLNVTGMTILNNFTSSFGSDAVAAMGIAHKLTLIPVQISMGMGQAVMPLIGYNFSSGNARRMRDAFLFAAKVSTGFLLAMLGAYYGFAGPLIKAFMDNGPVIAYGTKFLRAACLCLPFLGMDFLAVGVFQATGKGALSLLFAVLRKVVLEIPAMILLNHFLPLYGLPYAQPVAEVVLAVVAVIILARMFRRLENQRTLIRDH